MDIFLQVFPVGNPHDDPKHFGHQVSQPSRIQRRVAGGEQLARENA